MSNLKEKLHLAVKRGIIDADVVDPLHELLSDESELEKLQGKFDFLHLVWFVGIVLLFLALVVFAFYVEKQFDVEGLLILFSAYSIGLLVASNRAFSIGAKFLSALFLVCFTVITPFIPVFFATLYFEIETDCLETLFLFALLVVSSSMIFFRQFPLLIVVAYAAIIGLFFHEFGYDIASKSIWFVIGWLTMALSWCFNLKTKLNFPFWLNKIALAGLAYGFSQFITTFEGETIISVYSLLFSCWLLIIALYLRYPSFVATGTIGVAGYVNYLVFQDYEDSLLIASCIIALQAAMLIWVGNKVYLHRAKFNAIIEKYMPRLFFRYRPIPLTEPLSFGIDFK